MDIGRIKALIDAMATSDLNEMEITEDGWSLRLVRQFDPATAAISTEFAKSVPTAERSAKRPPPTPQAQKRSNDIAAPMFGVVFLSASPDTAAFVAAGQQVKKGAVVCIVEAMKVFNEVRAPSDGVIDEILISGGEEVEAGQVLMRFAHV